MGRVRKYKKIKSCDPFYRGPRKGDKDINLPPTGEDNQSSKSFRSFLQTFTKTKNSEKHLIKEHVSKTNEKKRYKRPRELNDEKSCEEKDIPEFKKLKGESSKQFLARVNNETNQRLATIQKKVHKTSERRKQYYKERKLKLKLRKLGVNLEDADGIDFQDLKDHVRFGEVAHQPPQLSTRPRGATTCNKKVNSLILSKTSSCTSLSDGSGLKQKQDMENERERVIKIYKQTKKR